MHVRAFTKVQPTGFEAICFDIHVPLVTSAIRGVFDFDQLPSYLLIKNVAAGWVDRPTSVVIEPM